MAPFAEYLASIRNELAAGDSTEHTHRPALKRLLESAAPGVTATNEPKRILCGSPDFQVARKGVPLGHVETKDIGANLDEMERGKGPARRAIHPLPRRLAELASDRLSAVPLVRRRRETADRARLAEVDAKGKLKPLPDGERSGRPVAHRFSSSSPP